MHDLGVQRFDQFKADYDAGRPQVVWVRLVADLETPVSAMMKLAAGKPNSFLLESVEGGAIRGRYSFIGTSPDLIWKCSGNLAEINKHALDDPGASARLLKDFAKECSALEVKMLSVGGKLLPAADIDVLAKLPTYEQAISQLMSVMQAPISKFVRTLAAPHTKLVRTVAAVRDQKQAS